LFIYRILIGLITITLFNSGCTNVHKPHSIQELSSHTIYVLDQNLEPKDKCTATAIGPHAMLTAEHCVSRLVPDNHIFFNIDISTHVYSIRTAIYDDHDHVIYLLTGPAFKYFLPYRYLISSHVINSTKVVAYGATSGTVFGTTNPSREDLSDVDQLQGVRYYHLKVDDGDSGSLIYTPDGSVSSMVTYRVGKDSACGFTLNFPDDIYYIAQLNFNSNANHSSN
jgi:hypothetical protein